MTRSAVSPNKPPSRVASGLRRNDADQDAFLHNADAAESFACHDAKDFRHQTVEGR